MYILQKFISESHQKVVRQFSSCLCSYLEFCLIVCRGVKIYFSHASTKAQSFFSLVILLMSSVCISFYGLVRLHTFSHQKLMQTEHISKITNEKKDKALLLASYYKQGMCKHGCSGCMNPQIFGTSPFAPADFEASSTMCTRCFEIQSSPGCTSTRRFKFLTHSLVSHVCVTLSSRT